MGRMAPPKERARAWVYAVINPWADALAFENNVLETGSVSYRWRRKDFEYLRPIKRHLMRGADLILDDLIRFYDPGRSPAPFRDGPGEWQKQHDQQLDALRSTAQKAFEDLDIRQQITEALERAIGETPESAKRADIEPGKLESYRSQLSERILNNVLSLSDDYADSDFWNHHRQRFIPYRNGTDVDRMDSEREKLKTMNEEHARKLAELRNRIVDEFDVPPAFVG